MSLGHGASIVRDGLVLHLDAANVKSYPGSGTTWNDVSGNGKNATLVNGTQKSNTAMLLDGTNDYIEFQDDVLLGNNFSVSLSFKQTEARTDWVRLIGHSNDTTNRFWGIWIPVSRANLLWQSYNNGGQYTTPSLTFDLNKVYEVTFVSAGSTRTFYVNGEFVGSSNSGGLINYSTNSSKIRIGYAGFHTYHKGDIYYSMIYNRTLSANEVRQNFEALRGRYGI